jgi:hypothetical protein
VRRIHLLFSDSSAGGFLAFLPVALGHEELQAAADVVGVLSLYERPVECAAERAWRFGCS